MNYRCVIFDLDNTLYDELDYYKGTFNEISKIICKELVTYNETLIYEQILSEFLEKGSQFPLFFKYISNYYNLDESFHKKFFEIHKTLKYHIKLYPDAYFILDWLKKNLILLAIITNGTPDIQKNKINLLNLNNIFDYICFARNTGKEKPDMLPYKLVLENLKVSANETIYIGDNPYNDFQGAKKINISTVRILRGEFKDLKVNKEIIDYNIKNFYEFKEIMVL